MRKLRPNLPRGTRTGQPAVQGLVSTTNSLSPQKGGVQSQQERGRGCLDGVQSLDLACLHIPSSWLCLPSREEVKGSSEEERSGWERSRSWPKQPTPCFPCARPCMLGGRAPPVPLEGSVRSRGQAHCIGNTVSRGPLMKAEPLIPEPSSAPNPCLPSHPLPHLDHPSPTLFLL